MARLSFIKLILVLGIVFSIYPVMFGYFNLAVGSAPFSILNKGDNGLSLLRDALERKGFETKVIISSLNILRSLNETSLLIIMAPTLPFTIEETLTILDFILRGGSLLIVDDFSQANSLLRNLWSVITLSQEILGGKENVIFEGIYFNSTATLIDVENFYKTPTNPVITRFNDIYGILSPNVRRIVTSFPSTLSIKVRIKQNNEWISLIAAIPGSIGFLASSSKSWLETNLSSAIEGTMTPDPWEWGGVSFSLGLVLELPTGSRLALISDPDIFSNKLVMLDDYDNMNFALDLIKWLLKNQKGKIFFDESHLPHAIHDPLFGLSIIYKAITFLSYSWIVAPVIPLSIVITLLGYVPKKTRFRPRLLSKVERILGTQWLSSRLEWYKRSRNYNHMALILLNSLRQEIRRVYGIWKEDLEEMLQELFTRQPEIAKYSKEIEFTFKTLDLIVRGRQKINDEKFLVLVDKVRKIRGILRR